MLTEHRHGRRKAATAWLQMLPEVAGTAPIWYPTASSNCWLDLQLSLALARCRDLPCGHSTIVYYKMPPRKCTLISASQGLYLAVCTLCHVRFLSFVILGVFFSPRHKTEANWSIYLGSGMPTQLTSTSSRTATAAFRLATSMLLTVCIRVTLSESVKWCFSNGSVHVPEAFQNYTVPFILELVSPELSQGCFV